MRYGSLLCVCAVVTTACATGVSNRPLERPGLPTPAELQEHVRQDWPSWVERFSRLSSRTGEAADLVGVTDVSCSYTYDTPECWLIVTGRFVSGDVVPQRMFSQFERDQAGNLREVIVMWHVRRR